LKFKMEISLLLSAIILYIVSVACFSYEATTSASGSENVNPYRIYAFPLIAIASVLLAAAAILYSRHK